MHAIYCLSVYTYYCLSVDLMNLLVKLDACHNVWYLMFIYLKHYTLDNVSVSVPMMFPCVGGALVTPKYHIIEISEE